MTNDELDVKCVKLLGDDYCIDDGNPIKIGSGGFHPAWSITDAMELRESMPDGWIMYVTITKDAVSVDVGRGCIGDAVFSWQGQHEARGRTEAFIVAMEAKVP